ncbi:MAG: hypothetical protein IPP66_01220 [Anaerolineales bacterium]|nr:hypothetical protein [Anaerolineales bacterium]
MKNILKKFNTLSSQPFTIPLALFIVTILAYGLSFWRLGFYWDDQPISWIRYQLGMEATTKYFSDSRPVWALLYQLSGFLLPNQPAYWQVFAMVWRWAGVYAFWLVLVRLFPRRKDIAFFMALLVLVYPGFNQQWVSYVYSHFFIVLFFLLISWHLMLRGKTIPAMIFSALHLVMFEYFFLLEFLRPVIIFMSLREEPMTNRERYIKTFKIWLPYIGSIAFAVLYRSLVYSHPGFGYSLTEELVRAPIETFTQLLSHVFSSLWVAAVGAWIQVFQFPNTVVNGLRTTVLYVVVVLVVGVFLFIMNRADDEKRINTKSDPWWLLGLGLFLLLLGGVPYWATNLPVTLGFPANRALLSFMFGACFLLLGLLELLPVRIKYPVVILFVALSVGRQFLWSVEYLRDWQNQKNLFWQLSWRAPGLKPDTLLLMNEELLFSADNSISAPLNWIYKTSPTSDMDYFIAYPTNRLGNSLSALEKNIPISYDFLAGTFKGNTSDALAFYYDPPSCLRLLEPDLDSKNRFILDESLMREASALSNTDRIIAEQQAVMPAIYGPEPEHGWCYYFEKADLARQFDHWDEVAKLGDQAFKLDDFPNNPVERFVFIEGYAHTGDWDQAIQLSKVSYKVSKEYVGPLLCQLWKRIEAETAEGPGRADALSQAQSMFICNR